jgi:hypothetical protein
VRPVPIRPAGRMAAEWVEAPCGATDRPSPGALSEKPSSKRLEQHRGHRIRFSSSSGPGCMLPA